MAALLPMLLLLAVACWLLSTKAGRAWVALRDSETAAQAMGINLAYYKTLAFAVSGFYTGIAGALDGHLITSIHPEGYTFTQSIQFLTFIVVGGMASIPGSIMGAVFLTVVQQMLSFVRQEVAHTLRARRFGIVVGNAEYRLANLEFLPEVLVGSAQSMIEHHHAGCADFGFHQRFHFRIVDAPHLRFIEEIFDLRVMMDESKSLAFEHKALRFGPAIVDHDVARIRLAARLHECRPRTARKGIRRLSGVEDVVDSRFDRTGGDVQFRCLSHTQPPLRLPGAGAPFTAK